MNTKYQVATIFGIAAMASTVLVPIVWELWLWGWDADFFPMFIFPYSILNGISAFLWARTLFPNIDIEGVPKTRTIVFVGTKYELSITLLTFLTLPIVALLVLLLISSEPVGFSYAIQVIYGWVIVGSLFSLGIPYFIGTITGILVAYYIFKINTRNKLSQPGTPKDGASV